jgi:hypothetical protein
MRISKVCLLGCELSCHDITSRKLTFTLLDVLNLGNFLVLLVVGQMCMHKMSCRFYNHYRFYQGQRLLHAYRLAAIFQDVMGGLVGKSQVYVFVKRRRYAQGQYQMRLSHHRQR